MISRSFYLPLSSTFSNALHPTTASSSSLPSSTPNRLSFLLATMSVVARFTSSSLMHLFQQPWGHIHIVDDDNHVNISMVADQIHVIDVDIKIQRRWRREGSLCGWDEDDEVKGWGMRETWKEEEREGDGVVRREKDWFH